METLSYSSFTKRLYSSTLAEEMSPLAGVDLIRIDTDLAEVSANAIPRQFGQQSCRAVIMAVVEDDADTVAQAPIDHRFAFADIVVCANTASAVAAQSTPPQVPGDTNPADEVIAAVAANPIAASVLVQLLRHNEVANTEDRLFAESLAYSTLQHGKEFTDWLADRTSKPVQPNPEPAVVVERDDNELILTLNRPERRNAYSAAMRDALCDALHLAMADSTISLVRLRGAGVCFSAGGDLDEFGEARDAGSAHVARTGRSAGRLIHALANKVIVDVHGACIGAGIELPAFAGTLRAQAGTFFQLPEVSMGLIPGAGGTASILPRIGRQRLGQMALTGSRITTQTALAWGLIDEIVD